MKRFKRTRWMVLPVFAAAALAATLFAASGNAKKDAFTYVNVGGAAFTQESNLNANCTFKHRTSSGAAYSGAITELYDDCDYVAHVDLPDGMAIVDITAYYNNADADGTFRLEAHDDVGSFVELAGGQLDGTEGGAVCDGNSNCSATWVVGQKITNKTTHYGIDWEGDEDPGFLLYRFLIKLRKN